MGPFEMVVLVVFIAVGAGVIQKWLKTKEKLAESATLDAATDKRIAALEDRIRVLERIVTDKTSRLKEEIDAL